MKENTMRLLKIKNNFKDMNIPKEENKKQGRAKKVSIKKDKV